MTTTPRCHGLRRISRAKTWGGRLVDIEMSGGWITDVAAAGDTDRLAATKASGGASWDVAGRLVLPGLWDYHVHVDQWAEASARVDLTEAQGPHDVIAAMAAGLARRGGRAVLIGVGFQGAPWLAAVTAADLDRASATVPLVAIAGDWHTAWLNTPALALARSNAVVSGDGVVREDEWFNVTEHFTPAATAGVDRLVTKAMIRAARHGVVGLVDFEKGSAWRAWQRRYLDGFAGMRVIASVWEDGLDDAIEAGMRTGDPLLAGNPLGTMGPLKVIADGALGSRTAACRLPYPRGGRGWLLRPATELAPLLSKARAAGIEAAVHAIGDRAVGEVLRAFSAAGARGSIEHAQLLAHRDIRRIAAQGLTASVQPQHLLDDRDAMEENWRCFAKYAFQFRLLAEAGVRLAFGSDAPVAPLDPWQAISAATYRTDGERPPWYPEQCLPIAASLAAAMPPRRSDAGPDERLEPRVGDPADLMWLDEDPRTMSASDLREMPVAGTMVAGTVTFENW